MSRIKTTSVNSQITFERQFLFGQHPKVEKGAIKLMQHAELKNITHINKIIYGHDVQNTKNALSNHFWWYSSNLLKAEAPQNHGLTNHFGL